MTDVRTLVLSSNTLGHPDLIHSSSCVLCPIARAVRLRLSCVLCSGCMAYFCAACQYGTNVSARLNNGSGCGCPCFNYVLCQMFCPSFVCCLIAQSRTALRRRVGIREGCCVGDCSDYCIAMLCPSCSMAQEAREIKHREKELSAHSGAVMMTPPPVVIMQR